MLLCLLLSVVYLSNAVRLVGHRTYLYGDPTGDYYSTASLLADGDLDLRNQLDNDFSKSGSQMALGRHGEWYNVHEPLLPIIALPFFAALGDGGLLLLNMLLTIGSVVILASMLSAFVPTQPAFYSALLVGLSPHFVSISYSFSHDVLGAFLLVAAFFALARGRLIISSFLLGLLFFARIPFLCCVPAYALYVLFRCRAEHSSFRKCIMRIVRFSLPLILCLSGFLILNWLLFGNPWETSYDRWLPGPDAYAVSSHRVFFGENLSGGFFENFFGREKGIVFGGPFAVFVMIMGCRETAQKNRPLAIFVYALSLSVLVLFTLYAHGTAEFPSRYHLPIIAFSSVPCAYLFNRMWPASSSS